MQRMQEKLIKRWTIHLPPIPFKMMENRRKTVLCLLWAAVINQSMCHGQQLSGRSSVLINTVIAVFMHTFLVSTHWLSLLELITITETRFSTIGVWKDVRHWLRFVINYHTAILFHSSWLMAIQRSKLALIVVPFPVHARNRFAIQDNSQNEKCFKLKSQSDCECGRVAFWEELKAFWWQCCTTKWRWAQLTFEQLLACL